MSRIKSQTAKPEEVLDYGAFHDSSVPMYIFDISSLMFLEVNEAAVARYGYSRREFLGVTILDIRPSTEIPALLRVTAHPHQQSSSSKGWLHRTRKGRVFSVEITTRQLRFGGRDAELVIARDPEVDAEIYPLPIRPVE